MNAPKFTALGVDAGGTKITAGVVTFPAGIVRTRREIPTLPQRGGEAVLTDVERLVSDLAAEAGADGHPVQGIVRSFSTFTVTRSSA